MTPIERLLAIEEINTQGILGDSKIVLEKRDSASDTQTAVSQSTEAIADKSVSALLGPVLSSHAVAIAPLAERAQLPTIFTQAGSEGVVIGDYTYRATAPMDTYFTKSLERLRDQGVETVSVLYNAGNVTLAGSSLTAGMVNGADTGAGAANIAATGNVTLNEAREEHDSYRAVQSRRGSFVSSRISTSLCVSLPLLPWPMSARSFSPMRASVSAGSKTTFVVVRPASSRIARLIANENAMSLRW